MPEQIVNSFGIQTADKLAVQSGITIMQLMNAAAQEVFEEIQSELGSINKKHFWIFCGKGNNGGDGLALARILFEREASILVVLANSEDQIKSPETIANLKSLQELQKQNSTKLQILFFNSIEQLKELTEADYIVDALLGTGFQGNPQESYFKLIQFINSKDAFKVSVDIPSGLNADTGKVQEIAIKADFTVTLAAKKIGCLINEGPNYTGKLIKKEIGIPEQIIAKVSIASLASDDDISQLLPERMINVHKYNAGACLIIAGSNGMSGAAIMASFSSYRIGAGIVTAAVPSSVQNIIAGALPEAVTLALQETEEGSISLQALPVLLETAKKVDAVLIGCGLGKNEETQRLIIEFLKNCSKPLLIDADGLNALQNKTDIIQKYSNGKWILTPHSGELTRLIGDYNPNENLQLAKDLARQWNCTLIIKGMPSIVASPSGEAYINATGNAALAKAGTGDVLSGLITGLLAQRLKPPEAALAGLHIGGSCADEYIKNNAARTMLATDLIKVLPRVLKERFHD